MNAVPEKKNKGRLEGLYHDEGSEGAQPELRPELYMIESDGVRFVKTEFPGAGPGASIDYKHADREGKIIESKLFCREIRKRNGGNGESVKWKARDVFPVRVELSGSGAGLALIPQLSVAFVTRRLVVAPAPNTSATGLQ